MLAALAALAVTHALQSTPHRLPPLAAASLAVDEATTLPIGPARDAAAMALALDEARTAASKGEVVGRLWGDIVPILFIWASHA